MQITLTKISGNLYDIVCDAIPDLNIDLYEIFIGGVTINSSGAKLLAYGLTCRFEFYKDTEIRYDAREQLGNDQQAYHISDPVHVVIDQDLVAQKRIIIWDYFGEHADSIQLAILSANTMLTANNIIKLFSTVFFSDCLAAAPIEAIIHSYAGVQSYINFATSIYPRIQMFFPLGGTNNVFQQVNIFQEQEPPVIITSGAGDEELRNNTSYGNGLEFWDWDLIQTEQPSSDQSSFSNGIILGKLLRIKDTLNCSWPEARYRARMTADRNEPNRETSPWDLHNGYGRINVQAAIANPRSITVEATITQEKVRLNWAAVSGATSYKIYRQARHAAWEHIAETAEVIYLDETVTRNAKGYNYKVVAICGEQQAESNIVRVPFLKIDRLYFKKSLIGV